MKRNFVIMCLLSAFMLMMVPSISAIQFSNAAEVNIKSLSEKIQSSELTVEELAKIISNKYPLYNDQMTSGFLKKILIFILGTGIGTKLTRPNSHSKNIM